MDKRGKFERTKKLLKFLEDKQVSVSIKQNLLCHQSAPQVYRACSGKFNLICVRLLAVLMLKMNLQERIDIVVTVFVCLKHRKLFTSRLLIKQITNGKQKKGTLYNVQ